MNVRDQRFTEPLRLSAVLQRLLKGGSSRRSEGGGGDWTAWSLLRLNHIIVTDPLRRREAELLKVYLQDLQDLQDLKPDVLAIEYTLDDGGGPARGDALLLYRARVRDDVTESGVQGINIVALECKASTSTTTAIAAASQQAKRMAAYISSYISSSDLHGILGVFQVRPRVVVGWNGRYRVVDVPLPLEGPPRQTRHPPATREDRDAMVHRPRLTTVWAQARHLWLRGKLLKMTAWSLDRIRLLTEQHVSSRLTYWKSYRRARRIVILGALVDVDVGFGRSSQTKADALLYDVERAILVVAAAAQQREECTDKTDKTDLTDLTERIGAWVRHIVAVSLPGVYMPVERTMSFAEYIKERRRAKCNIPGASGDQTRLTIVTE
ncbi:hypothetical protein HYH03_018630 [Edaphochlamys debaryana]|uniref:Uncharacterized protein n=1 Tax=Edaphochlamys debaryana TaxID=47281 RepID=A0A836BMR2_9CHLO|nr:hypothetical protein HYH03_018630 [Edaphochlamys debaryana]|eukprot:KAG2482426.1 hypothetical protein HYH03_018630 [Edaphochlamys debaryana]